MSAWHTDPVPAFTPTPSTPERPYTLEIYDRRYSLTREQSLIAQSMLEYGVKLMSDIGRIDSSILQSPHFRTTGITLTFPSARDPSRTDSYRDEPMLPCLAHILVDILEWKHRPTLSYRPSRPLMTETESVRRLHREQGRPHYRRGERVSAQDQAVIEGIVANIHNAVPPH